MPKNKELKYRAICPLCDKPFDMREGKLLFVENYNKCMDWNKDILDKFNFDIKYAKDFVKIKK